MERRETERFSGPVHTWADVPPRPVPGRTAEVRREGGGSAAARSGGRTGRPARQGAAWTQDEEDRVRRLHGAGKGISQIAVALERSPLAVEKRLEALGLSSDGIPVGAA